LAFVPFWDLHCLLAVARTLLGKILVSGRTCLCYKLTCFETLRHHTPLRGYALRIPVARPPLCLHDTAHALPPTATLHALYSHLPQGRGGTHFSHTLHKWDMGHWDRFGRLGMPQVGRTDLLPAAHFLRQLGLYNSTRACCAYARCALALRWRPTACPSRA